MCKMAISHLHAQHWFQHTFVKYMINFEDFMSKMDFFKYKYFKFTFMKKKSLKFLFFEKLTFPLII
jgi:hypothetical protein